MAGDGDLHVDPAALSKYGMDMQLYSMQAGMPISIKLSTVEVDSSGAFGGLSGLDAGVFAEGPVMQAAMEKQSYAFNAFLADLTNGLQAIGNAANVCAYAYNATDVESAEKMNLLGYAFATDPDAKAPPGLPKEVNGETLLDRQLAGQGTGLPQALTDPDSGTTANIYNGGYLTTYGDGSTKVEHTQADPNVPGGSVLVTTISAPGGQVLSTTTTKTTYAASGTSSEYYRQVVTPGHSVTGADGKPEKAADTTVTTQSAARADGGRTITTTTTVGEQKPDVSTVQVAPPETAPRTDEEAGPLEQTQDELGTDAGQVDWRKGYQGVQAPG